MSGSRKTGRLDALVITNVGHLAIQFGYLLTKLTGQDALQEAAPVALAGGLALVLFVGWRMGLRLAEFTLKDWGYVGLLCLGVAASGYAYLQAGNVTTFATAAVAYTVGTNSVGLGKIVRQWRTAWGSLNLLLRATVLGLAVWLAGSGYEPVDPAVADTGFAIDVMGAVWLLLTAAGAFITVFVSSVMTDRGLANQCGAFANLLAAPLLFVLAFVVRPDTNWTDAKFLGITGAVGVLTIFAPVLLFNFAIRRSSGREVGVLLSLSAPVAALVTLFASEVLHMEIATRTTLEGWIALCLITVAAAAVPLIREPDAAKRQARHRRPQDKGGRREGTVEVKTKVATGDGALVLRLTVDAGEATVVVETKVTSGEGTTVLKTKVSAGREGPVVKTKVTAGPGAVVPRSGGS